MAEMMRIDVSSNMRICLKEICIAETVKNYAKRNELVLELAVYAQQLGFNVGIRIDEKEPDWPVVFVELPTGQVSWHIEQYDKEWDGHDTDEKYRRVAEFLGLK